MIRKCRILFSTSVSIARWNSWDKIFHRGVITLPTNPDLPVEPGSAASETPVAEKKTTKKPSPLVSYVSQRVSKKDLDFLTRKVLRVQAKSPVSAYLIDQGVGQSIRKTLEKEDLDKEATVIEISPGLGVLTKELIELGFNNLNCFEEEVHLALRLQYHFRKVHVLKRRFLRLAELCHVDQHDGENRVGLLLGKLRSKEGCNRVYIVGVTPRVDTINFTIRSLVSNRVFYDVHSGFENPVYYLLVGPQTYQILSAGPSSGFYKYRPTTVLFHLLFKWQLLDTFPREAFIPWEKSSERRKKKKSASVSEDKIYLIKFETNIELVNQLKREHLFSLFFFVRHNLHSRKKAVIASLEKFVPDCGPRLIRKGYSIFTNFGDLSPEELLELYFEFTSWPEFEYSSFESAADSLQSRLELADEDILPEEGFRQRK